MTSEVVTVRMSRGDLTTPWGFTVQHPAVINNIIGSSLADRAGLQNGDVIEEIQGYQNPDYAAATHALEASKHSIEIVVIRNAGTPRLWKPQLSENAEMNRFQHSVHNMGPPAGNPPPPPPPTSHPIKVSLEHRKEEVPIRGFNVSAKPFASSEIQASNQQQYNTPINLYNAQSAAEQYLQQTGGLFGTDPNLAKQKEEPAYLRSETLRLIRENDEHARGERLTTPAVSSRYSPRINELDPLRNQPNPQGLPQCYLCGRNILGVMCRAFNHDLHADCFTCATCGSSLKNQGHHFLNDKFYCDIHGRQLMGRGPSMDPEKAARSPPTAVHPVKTPEPVKAFYQPEVMTRQPISLKSVSPTPWNTTSPISPSKRGVPPSHTGFGQQIRQTTTTSHYETSPNHLTPNSNIGGGNNNYTRTETHQHYEHQQQQQQQQNNNHYQQEHTEGNRGKGTLMSNVNRIPYCEHCKQQIRGAFVLATGLTWCPEHFTCANQSCGRKLLDVGFVEEKGKKYCEQCFERLIAPQCSKCRKPITADCLNALQKQWHPHCFVCAHCHKPFGNSAFYLEQGQPYCEEDWNSLFTTKCVSCKFPIEAGDRWVEALGSAFHSNCFNCTTCQINLEGESFYAKNGAPYCKAHA